MSGSAKKKGGDKDEDRMTKVVFIYDRMAMLLREMLTLSMLAERFKLARKISAANLSSQTRDMASSYNFQKNSFHCNSDSMTKFLRNLKKKKKILITLVAFSFVNGSAGKFISFASASVRKSK